MKNKNLIYLAIAAGAGYYLYKQSKNKATNQTSSSQMEMETGEQIEEKKPKTFLQKAAALVQKAANTKEGKNLIAKGKATLAKKLKLKKMGADYLYL
jgi:uncharacterized protein HemX